MNQQLITAEDAHLESAYEDANGCAYEPEDRFDDYGDEIEDDLEGDDVTARAARAREIAAHLLEDTYTPEHLEGLSDKRMRDAVLAAAGEFEPDDDCPTPIILAAPLWPLAAMHCGVIDPADLAAGYMIGAVFAYLHGDDARAINLADIARRLSATQSQLAEMLMLVVVGKLPPLVFHRDVMRAITVEQAAA